MLDPNAFLTLWDASLGDTFILRKRSEGSENEYGRPAIMFSPTSANKGRVIVLKGGERILENASLKVGDAVILTRLGEPFDEGDEVEFQGLFFKVFQVNQLHTHLEVFAKRKT